MIEKGNKLKLCLGCLFDFSLLNNTSNFEDLYTKNYKPLISFIYGKPDLPLTIYISGAFIDWVSRYHEEFFMILEELVQRKQIEVLGGGFHSPLFPLLPPSDRVGQIELLTTNLRKQVGKRPRGAWLPASAWESSMIASLNTCGIEYILLDKLMFDFTNQKEIDGTFPVILEDNGKTIIAFPFENSYANLNKYTPEAFIESLMTTYTLEKEQIAVVILPEKNLSKIFAENSSTELWIEKFLNIIAQQKNPIELTTPGKILKTKQMYTRASIPSGISPFYCEDCFNDKGSKISAKTSLKQLLIKSTALYNLYAKNLYVYSLVNQIKGDKTRKKNAREDLWKSQNIGFFIIKEPAPTYNEIKLRNLAYRYLLRAEKTSRIRGVFTPSINSYDFDLDGIKEYLCQLETHNSYVHAKGGKIFEFDILAVHRNYINLDTSNSGLFIDHFFSIEEAQQLKQGKKLALPSVFAESLYYDTNIDSSKIELNLRTNGYFGSFQQPIALKKQYVFRNEGIQVQYILKNESPFPLSGIFATELDLAITSESEKKPIMAVYTEDIRKESPIETSTFEDVSWIRFDDPETGVRFTLDSNENPTATVIPVSSSLSTKVFLSWKVELSPNYETEKMVFLKISC